MRVISHETRYQFPSFPSDGAKPINLINDPSGDFIPDWQPPKTRR